MEFNAAVSDKSLPSKTDVEEASSRLAEGLKNCRSVLKDYRALLTGDHDDPPAEQSEESDKQAKSD